MNKLLARQLRRNKIDINSLPGNFQHLLRDISESYDHQEADRSLIERSIDLSSQELTEANSRLRLETERQKVVLENLKSALLSLPEQSEKLFVSSQFEKEDIILISDFLTKQIQRRKEAEKTIKLYERAINASNNGIVITDYALPDNPLMFANPAFYETTGYSPEEVLGKNCRFLQGDNVDQEELVRLRKAIREHRACTVKLLNYKKDGSSFWNELRISPIFDDDGRVTNYIGIQSDITKSVRSEEKLRDSNARLSEFIENMPSGILVEDEHRKLVVTNTEFCRMFTIPVWPEELIGIDCAVAADQSKDLFAEPAKFLSRIDEILNKKDQVRNEELNLNDGRVFERDFIPIIIGDRYKGYLWNYRDISERKKIENEIKELKSFYEKTLNDLPGQIAVFDSDFKYIYVNPGSIKTPEVRGWIIGKDDFDFCRNRNIDISIAESRREKLELAKKEKMAVKFDETLVRGEETFYLERTVSPIIDEYGEVKRILAYGIDITERKKSENELLKIKSQLEISNKALSDFAYIASHDLREPLRKITAFGSLLAKTAASKLDEDDKENLSYMIQGAKRMQQMIDDLLHYSRITVKIQSFMPVNLDALLNEILTFDLSELIEDNKAYVRIENELGSLNGEKTQLKQLFQNLIANGIKYRKKDIPPVVTVKSKNDGHSLFVEVEDNGIGIQENYVAQIFEMFRRLHAREEYGGSGIGLAVCKKIVELYKGEIGVKSVYGAGSVFWFKIPITGE